MLAKFTRWLEAGLPVELPLVTLLKARQRHQSVGVIAVPAHAGAFQRAVAVLHIASVGLLPPEACSPLWVGMPMQSRRPAALPDGQRIVSSFQAQRHARKKLLSSEAGSSENFAM